MFLWAYKACKAQKVHKAQNVKQAIFFFIDVFYTHEIAVFFVLHTKKLKKHIKRIKKRK